MKCVVACLIGNICHVAWKFHGLYVDHKKANEHYSFGQFLKDDKVPLIVDLILSFALVYVADEFIVDNEWIMNKIKIVFLFIGFTGSYITMQLMSVGTKKFRAMIDEKSNIADGKREEIKPK